MRIHLINLDRSRERLCRFHTVNAHLTNVVRFPAVDGATLDRDQLIAEGFIVKDLAYPPSVLGCAMSHVALWKKAVETDTPVTVCEDDAIFSKSFPEKSLELMSRAPSNWDAIFWGYGLQNFTWVDFMPGIVGAELRWEQTRLTTAIDSFQDMESHPSLVKLLHEFGMICYSVSPKGAKLLLEACLPITQANIAFKNFGITIENKGIDCVMNKILPSLEAFLCLPPLVLHEFRVPSTIGSR